MTHADQHRWIKTVSLAPPSLKDNTADTDRLVDTLKAAVKTDHIEIDYHLVKKIPEQLRKWNYRARCVLFKDKTQWILTAICNPGKDPITAGLAIDLGTTRVVTRIVDLETGETLSESAFDNPQSVLGPDILARIHYADTDGGLDHLNRLIIKGLNENIVRLCEDAGIAKENIHLASVAGNTAMTHLFLGLMPKWIIREPYIPVVNRPGVFKTADLGLDIHPFARILVFPNVGSYFGGDLIAGILYAGLNKSPDTAILVDVGTNAEVVLGNKDWLMACAGAAGPALEGGVTQMGMTAGPGVIDTLSIDPSSLEFHISTIDNRPPVGICGSGVIDLAAHLFLSGIIDIRGKIIADRAGSRRVIKNEEPHIVIADHRVSGTGKELSIGQADLDSLIRSKAAMYTILETITETVGMALNDLSLFYVAGTFGSFINPESAITIGMIPDLPLSAYKTLGNSSLEGATMALLSDGVVDEIDEIRDTVTYMELNVNQDFMNRFSAAKFIPHTDTSRFPNAKACP